MRNIYKGFERKMIVVKNPGDGIFEEAYFIIRRGMSDSTVSCDDMVSEASRIIDAQGEIQIKRKKGSLLREGLSFALGLLSGAVCFIVFLLLS